MNRHKKTALIVGADGLLGRALAAALSASGWDVITTTRRTQEVSKQNLYLDLSGDVIEWKPPPNVDAAFLCAAVTSLAACRENPEQSARINCENTYLIAEKLTRESAFVIYPSTNLVFDGTVPRCPANASVNPQTEYGRQKAEAERRILGLHNSAVVRFTKIIWPEMPLIRGWINDIKAGNHIRPFSDMALSPISLSLVSDVQVQAAEKKLHGITQISGDRDITYAEFAQRIADRLGAPPDFVQPIHIKDSGVHIEAAPPHTTLNTDRLESQFGITAPDVWNTIDSVFGL